MINRLAIAFLIISINSFSQNNEFLDFVNSFNNENKVLDSLTAKKFLGIDYKKVELEAYRDKVIFKSPFCVGLTFSFPCPAGGICDRTILIVYNYSGIKLDRLPDFEYEFADCSFDDSKRCVYLSDSILLTITQELKVDCDTEEETSKKVYVTSYSIDKIKGQIGEPVINQIDTRRDNYLISCEILSEDKLSGFDSNELSIMRNELFASHGYVFNTDKWSDFFSKKDWYSPTKKDVYDDFTLIEKMNLKTFIKLEKKK